MTDSTSGPACPAITAKPSNLYMDDPHRVLVADISAITRGHFKRILESDPCIKVVAMAASGDAVLDMIQNQVVDVVLFDPAMQDGSGRPIMPMLIDAAPQVKFILTAMPAPQDAEAGMLALEAGAADYITKPCAETLADPAFTCELLAKTRALAMLARTCGSRRRLKSVLIRKRVSQSAPARTSPHAPISILPQTYKIPALIAIGASTGGPQAILEVVSHFRNLPQPIVITQHMPLTFTPILAGHIHKKCGIPCEEGKTGTPLLPGHAYIAPGDHHMTIGGTPEAPVIILNENPPENYCRPSVDPMLRSAASVFGGNLLTLILTGMGQDGLMGCRHVVNAGGMVIAQDEDTSVVWGMPGAVALAGLCSAVLPLKEIGPFVADKIARLPG